MSTVAYALRKTIDADSFAGSVTLPDGVLFNVGEALDESAHSDDDRKVLVTSDPHIIAALDEYPALKHVRIPDSAADEVVHTVRVDPDLAGTSGKANEGVKPAPRASTGGDAHARQTAPQDDATSSDTYTDVDASSDEGASVDDVAPLDASADDTKDGE